MNWKSTSLCFIITQNACRLRIPVPVRTLFSDIPVLHYRALCIGQAFSLIHEQAFLGNPRLCTARPFLGYRRMHYHRVHQHGTRVGELYGQRPVLLPTDDSAASGVRLLHVCSGDELQNEQAPSSGFPAGGAVHGHHADQSVHRTSVLYRGRKRQSGIPVRTSASGFVRQRSHLSRGPGFPGNHPQGKTHRKAAGGNPFIHGSHYSHDNHTDPVPEPDSYRNGHYRGNPALGSYSPEPRDHARRGDGGLQFQRPPALSGRRAGPQTGPCHGCPYRRSVYLRERLRSPGKQDHFPRSRRLLRRHTGKEELAVPGYQEPLLDHLQNQGRT